MTHEHSNMLFTAANRWSLGRGRKNAVHKFNPKFVVGNCVCEAGRQGIRENVYVLWYLYRTRAPVRFMLKMSVNISGVPTNTAKPTQDGRIVGGNSARIHVHPHQVNLLICC